MTSRVKWRRVTNANCRQHPHPLPPTSSCHSLATLNGTNTFVSRTRVFLFLFFFFLSLVEHAHKSSVTLSWWFRVINRQLFRRLVYIWGVRLIVATTHTHTHLLTLAHTLRLSHMCINAFSNCPSPKNAAHFLAINQTISREHHQRVCDCVPACVCVWASVCGANLQLYLLAADIYLTFDKQTKKSWPFVF